MIYKIRVWCGVVDQDNNIIQIIDFFKSYSKYENIADYDLFNYLYPCIKVSQFEVFIERDGIKGFVSWAYLNDIAEFKFKRTGQIEQWNCGDKVWVVDVLSKRNAKNEIYWLKKYFSNKNKPLPPDPKPDAFSIYDIKQRREKSEKDELVDFFNFSIKKAAIYDSKHIFYRFLSLSKSNKD